MRRVAIRDVYLAALLLVLLAIASAWLLAADISEFALLAARYTARVGFVAFAVTYLVGPASGLWPESFFRRLLPVRRHLGLATAYLMGIHLVALAINVGFFRPRTPESMVAGGLVYVAIALLAATSNNASQRAMGKWWRRLHFIGVHAVLVTFLVSYSGRIFTPGYFWTGAIFAPLVASLLLVRIAAWMKRTRQPGASPATSREPSPLQ